MSLFLAGGCKQVDGLTMAIEIALTLQERHYKCTKKVRVRYSGKRPRTVHMGHATFHSLQSINYETHL
jgi:hypothetical protein